jgi:hypothetical protein
MFASNPFANQVAPMSIMVRAPAKSSIYSVVRGDISNGRCEFGAGGSNHIPGNSRWLCSVVEMLDSLKQKTGIRWESIYSFSLAQAACIRRSRLGLLHRVRRETINSPFDLVVALSLAVMAGRYCESRADRCTSEQG